MPSALAAAGPGKRAIVCEIASQERGARSSARPDGDEETRIAKGLWAISVDPDEAVREYLQVQMPVRAMGSCSTAAGCSPISPPRPRAWPRW